MRTSRKQIDWVKQWELFAPGFRDGHLPVRLASGEIYLLPGPGFGDLSHESTQLMMDYLPQVVDAHVIDIGCGSGILSLAAKALGARHVTGIDIDPDALEHAHQNALYNHLDITFCLPHQFSGANLGTLLLNMIFSEQQTAWRSLPSLHNFKGNLILSGLLQEHKKEALRFWQGWRLQESRTKGNWLLLHLNRI